MASAQTQPLKRGVEVSNKLDPDATLVRVVYTHRPGLHCDLCACVDARGLTIVRSDLRRAGRLRVHRFWVVDGRAGTKLEHAALTPLSLAVRDAVVDPGLWARWHGVENARARAARDAAGETTSKSYGVAGNGVCGAVTARVSVPATPGALRNVTAALERAMARGPAALMARFNATNLVGARLGQDDFWYAVADGAAMCDQWKAEWRAGSRRRRGHDVDYPWDC